MDKKDLLIKIFVGIIGIIIISGMIAVSYSDVRDNKLSKKICEENGLQYYSNKFKNVECLNEETHQIEYFKLED